MQGLPQPWGRSRPTNFVAMGLGRRASILDHEKSFLSSWQTQLLGYKKPIQCDRQITHLIHPPPHPPQDVHVLIPGTSQNVTLHSKLDFTEVAKDLKMEKLDYPGGSSVITGVLMSNRGRQEPPSQRRRYDERRRIWSDELKGTASQECGHLLEAEKGKVAILS